MLYRYTITGPDLDTKYWTESLRRHGVKDYSITKRKIVVTLRNPTREQELALDYLARDALQQDGVTVNIESWRDPVRDFTPLRSADVLPLRRRTEEPSGRGTEEPSGRGTEGLSGRGTEEPSAVRTRSTERSPVRQRRRATGAATPPRDASPPKSPLSSVCQRLESLRLVPKDKPTISPRYSPMSYEETGAPLPVESPEPVYSSMSIVTSGSSALLEPVVKDRSRGTPAGSESSASSAPAGSASSGSAPVGSSKSEDDESGSASLGSESSSQVSSLSPVQRIKRQMSPANKPPPSKRTKIGTSSESKGSASSGSASSGSAPAGSAPAGSASSGSAPAGSASSGSAPAGSESSSKRPADTEGSADSDNRPAGSARGKRTGGLSSGRQRSGTTGPSGKKFTMPSFAL